MATETTNIGLVKPADTDFYDVDVFNQNSDKIDAEIAKKSDSSHKHTTDDISGTLPISKGGTGGTTKEAAQSMLGILTADEIANLYVWKKYPGEPGGHTDTEVTDAVLASKSSLYGSNFGAVYYGDSYTFDGETFTLTNRKQITFSSTANDTTNMAKLDSVKGKYVSPGSIGGKRIYFIPSDATIKKKSVATVPFSTTQYVVESATELVSNNGAMEYAAAKSKSLYPTDGEDSSDGYYYVYHKQLGE